jgi:hypothetical protein
VFYIYRTTQNIICQTISSIWVEEWRSEGESERITFKSTIREWDRPKVNSCCPVCHSLPQRTLEKKLSENKYEMRREQICSFLFSISLYTPRFYHFPPILVFSFICMCSLTRLAIRHLRYTSVYLPLYCAVHLLHGRYCYLLVVLCFK